MKENDNHKGIFFIAQEAKEQIFAKFKRKATNETTKLTCLQKQQ